METEYLCLLLEEVDATGIDYSNAWRRNSRDHMAPYAIGMGCSIDKR